MANDDMALVRQYAASHSESAFEALVSRYTNLVYSAAFRRTGNSQLAEEITQAVFVILAQKAASLHKRTILSGWLYRAACYVSGHAIKQELRRQRREQEAYMQSLSDEGGTEVWSQITPLLEDAMMRLGQAERDALVLRFFEGHSLKEVGAALGASEAATKMRVARALEKLRVHLSRAGVHSTAETIAGAITANAVIVAPAMLAKTATAVALVKGATASVSISTLIKGAFKVMAWKKAQTTIVTGMGVLLVAGTATLTVAEIEHAGNDAQWDTGQLNTDILTNVPHIVKIIPTKFPNQNGWVSDDNGRMLGFGVTARELVWTAYGGSRTSQTTFPATLPRGKFDFVVNLPSGSGKALQQALKKQFGVIASWETRGSDVLLLKVKYPGAPGLKPSDSGTGSAPSNAIPSSIDSLPPALQLAIRNHQHGGGGGHGNVVGNGSMPLQASGQVLMTSRPISSLVMSLEGNLGEPILDQTGLTNRFDIQLQVQRRNGESYKDAFKRAVLDQLGLELVPGTAPVQMLVVEKVK